MKLVRHGRVVVAAVVLAGGVVGMLGAQPALAAHTNTGLYGYSSSSPFTGGCGDGGSGTLSSSSAQVSRTGSTISVTIQLTGAPPNTTYDAGLLQSGTCLSQTTVHQITTDNNGNRSVQFTEQAVAPPRQNPLIIDVAAPVAVPCCGGPAPEESPAYRSAVLKV
jgi:hypothetical protein